MNIKRAERKELDLLSQDIFGSSSRWQKLVDKGYDEIVTEEVIETIPAEKEGDEPKKQIVHKPVLERGVHKLVRKFHTIESVLEYMVEQKKQLDALRAQLEQKKKEFFEKIEADKAAKKAQEEADETAKRVHAAASGSAK